jgi:hypothetical protein
MPLAGAAPAGVVLLSRPPSRPNTAARSRRKPCVAGALRWAGSGNAPHWWPATGKVLYGLGPRKNHGLFRALLTLLDATYSARQMTRISVVVENAYIPKAKAVEQWVASHPRFAFLWLPTYCPRANPIARVFGDVHDKCTRNHQRKCLRDLVQDGERHMEEHGPWQYSLSRLYDAPEVTAAVENIAAEKHAKIAV